MLTPLPPISDAQIEILDVCCGEGGVSYGLQQAFPNARITGIDINAHPLMRYPYRSIQTDAIEYLRSNEARRYDFVWASFPCQRYSVLRSLDPTGPSAEKRLHSDLIEVGRDALEALNPPLSYILENVPTATFAQTMRADATLCGLSFGLRTYRHRIFESPLPIASPLHQKHSVPTTTINRKAQFEAGSFITVTGNVGSYCGPEAMGIDWMSGKGLSQAIPPAYAHYLARFIPINVTPLTEPNDAEIIAYA